MHFITDGYQLINIVMITDEPAQKTPEDFVAMEVGTMNFLYFI